MSHRPVTAYAGDLVVTLVCRCGRDRFDHRLVAVTACLLSHLTVALCDLDRLVECAGRKIIRMPEAVRRLRVVLANKVVGRMTVVARRDGVMARLLPGVVLLVHHMAVGTRVGVVAHVRIALGIDKRIDTDAGNDAYRYADDNEPEHFNR